MLLWVRLGAGGSEVACDDDDDDDDDTPDGPDSSVKWAL